MRRSLFAVTVFSSLCLVACEDGPNQPFNPAPDNAGDRWNDGKPTPAVDPATQGFVVDAGGGNIQEICTGPEKAKRWAKMVTEPIKPSRFGAGLDLAGGDDWHGLHIEEAEKINCQSTNDGDQFGDGTQVNYWGDNGEVWVDYLVSNRKIGFMNFWPGYLGTIDAKSRDGMHTFSIPVYTQVQKDSKPYTIDWNDPVKFPKEFNEIYDALTSTFAPGLPADPDCVGSGACVHGNFGDVAYMYMPALGAGFWVDNQNAAQPTASKFTRIDQYLAKTLPFSLAGPVLKLDQEGPVAHAGKLGKAAQPCDVKMGLAFSDFLSLCVKTTGDATADMTEFNKLVGGLSHNDERFGFDVQGIDLNFSAKSLKPTDVIHDKDLPIPSDIATQFDVDQSLLGKIANDRVGNDSKAKKDLHGAGLVYMEYARLVQDAINQYIPAANQHQLGAPECTTDVASGGTSAGVYADGCTGFEAFVTASPPVNDPANPLLDNLALGFGVTTVLPGMSLGLKAGHPKALFCLDANGDMATGYYECQSGDIFATSFAQVLAVHGGGKLANLPSAIQDVRFFWSQYMRAIIKYFMVAGSALETPDGVHAQLVDENNLFFDSIGAGQFEIGEYVDRRFASKTQDPTDLNVTADVKNGIFNDYSFSRELYRGETALYTAMLESQSDGPGQEDTATLTNIFGSPVLAGGWVVSSAGKSGYYCATHVDPAACDNQLPPLDGNGNPLLNSKGDPILTPYKGAFGGKTAFTLGQSAITIKQTYTNIQQAMITIPLHLDPYDQKSKLLPALDMLVPWIPKQPGEGFPISLTGTIDKFVETAQIDMSGTTITANLDYEIDPATNALNLLAVETTDFLGEVFLCKDVNTGDLLRARMYTPVKDIMDWFSGHPGSYADCGIVIRYSPYGNYADYITTLTNGVRLGITQGGGLGRVVDCTLFVPGQ